MSGANGRLVETSSSPDPLEGEDQGGERQKRVELGEQRRRKDVGVTQEVDRPPRLPAYDDGGAQRRAVAHLYELVGLGNVRGHFCSRVADDRLLVAVDAAPPCGV